MDAGPHASKALLKALPQVLADAVHLYLRVSVMQDSDSPALRLRLLHFLKQGVKVARVVSGQIDAVRVFVEEGLIIAESVLVHLKAGVHAPEHGIHIYAGRPGVLQGAFIRRETEGVETQVHASCRGYEPQQAQRRKNAAEKEENLPCIHIPQIYTFSFKSLSAFCLGN